MSSLRVQFGALQSVLQLLNLALHLQRLVLLIPELDPLRLHCDLQVVFVILTGLHLHLHTSPPPRIV